MKLWLRGLLAFVLLFPIFPLRAQYATLPRVLPPGFPTLPIMPRVVWGPGDVSYTDSLLDVYAKTYGPAMTGGIAMVSNSGSDSSGVLNDPRQPFQTIAYPLRKTTAQVIALFPGVYAPSDFDIRDVGGATPKSVVCLLPGSCTVRVLGGDDLSQSHWTQANGSAVYSTHIASDGTATGAPQRILLTDRVDQEGFPARIAQFTSVDALQAAGTGWFYDSSGHMLYVALDDQNVASKRSRLRALYFTPAGNAHIWLTGITVLFEGIKFEGISFDAIETQYQHQELATHLWISDFVQCFGAEFGFWDIGSTVYAQNGIVHANKVDGFNGNWSRTGAAGNSDVMLEASIVSSDAGDASTFGYAGPTLDNGSSSHHGYVASFGSIYERDWGPEFADNSSQDDSLVVPSVSWVVGSIARNLNPLNTTNYGGFQFAGVMTAAAPGDPRTRVVWMDTCQAQNEHGYGLISENWSVVHLFNSNFHQTYYGMEALTPVSYQPDNPR